MVIYTHGRILINITCCKSKLGSRSYDAVLGGEKNPVIFAFDEPPPKTTCLGNGWQTLLKAQGSVGRLTDCVMILVLLGLRVYTPENKHDIGNSPFSTGNTSSNSGFSIVMLVSGGYVYMNSSENH